MRMRPDDEGPESTNTSAYGSEGWGFESLRAHDKLPGQRGAGWWAMLRCDAPSAYVRDQSVTNPWPIRDQVGMQGEAMSVFPQVAVHLEHVSGPVTF